MTECPMTLLPVDGCSHCTGADQRAAVRPTIKPTRRTPIAARFPGSCDCCTTPFGEGAEIVAATIDGFPGWVLWAHAIEQASGGTP